MTVERNKYTWLDWVTKVGRVTRHNMEATVNDIELLGAGRDWDPPTPIIPPGDVNSLSPR